MITHALNGASALPIGTRTHGDRLTKTMAVRRCSQYHKAFRGTAVSYPADALRLYPVARWIRRHEVTVDVGTALELRQASTAGVLVPQIVIHCAGLPTPLLHCAVNIGAGRFVVDAREQVESLAAAMGRPPRVVVDMAAPDADGLVVRVAKSRRLNLIGLHYRLGGGGGATAADVVTEMIAQMTWIRREHSLILTRISLAELDLGDGGRHELRRRAAEIDDAVEEACIQFRHPRPALTIAPSRAALLLSAG